MMRQNRLALHLSIASVSTFVFAASAIAQSFDLNTAGGQTVKATPVAEFNEPWAMTFLPDGDLLVTEKPGKLLLVTQNGEKTEVEGVPGVDYGGQGGLGDIILHPDHADNKIVYLSYAEAGDGDTRGAAVARAVLERGTDGPSLRDVDVIWRQQPKVSGRGHYSHRLAFATDGKLFITSGDRQKKTPAQDMEQNLGKIIRLNDDGSVPQDNPFQDQGELAKTFWSLGHRNLLGIAFDSNGNLWQHEMGPRGGDEINLIEPGRNYGWPVVSNGDNYDGSDIPEHDTRPDFAAPEVYWNPVISPSGLVIYSGDMFPQWQGSGFIGGLSSQALVRVVFEKQADGDLATEAERFDMGARIREVEQGQDGALWLLEDRAGGRLLKLTPKASG